MSHGQHKNDNKDVKIDNKSGDIKVDVKQSNEQDVKVSGWGEIDFQQVNTQVVGSVNTGNINVSIDF